MNNELSKIIGKRINALLATQNKKQKDLAAALGVPDNTISYFVSGRRIPNTEQIKKIADFFSVSTDYLFGLTETQTTDKDVRFICDYTGLSEKSVDVLKFFNGYDILTPTINKLLESEGRSILEELNYQKKHIEQLPLDVKSDNLTSTVLKNYETSQIVSAIDQYLNFKKPFPKDDNVLNIMRSGKIVNLDDIENSLSSDTHHSRSSWEDYFTIETVKQGDLIERVLLDKVIEKIKQLKKDGEQNGNDTQA